MVRISYGDKMTFVSPSLVVVAFVSRVCIVVGTFRQSSLVGGGLLLVEPTCGCSFWLAESCRHADAQMRNPHAFLHLHISCCFHGRGGSRRHPFLFSNNNSALSLSVLARCGGKAAPISSPVFQVCYCDRMCLACGGVIDATGCSAYQVRLAFLVWEYSL